MQDDAPPRTFHIHRARLRTSRENAATGLIQRLLRDPQETAARLERDILDGADRTEVLALLDAAEQLGRLRGLTLAPLVGAVRRRIERRAS